MVWVSVFMYSWELTFLKHNGAWTNILEPKTRYFIDMTIPQDAPIGLRRPNWNELALDLQGGCLYQSFTIHDGWFYLDPKKPKHVQRYTITNQYYTIQNHVLLNMYVKLVFKIINIQAVESKIKTIRSLTHDNNRHLENYSFLCL